MLAASSLLAACQAIEGYPKAYQDADEVIKADGPYLLAGVRDIANAASDQGRAGLSQQQYRDSVVYRRIEVINIHYYDFEAILSSAYDGLNTGADLAALVLNGFGATTGSAATKAALAAASSGVLGAKTTINTDIFYQKTLPALIAQMRAQRQKIYAQIRTGLTKSYADYSIDQALDDVNSFYIAGTLPGAIMELTVQAGATLDAANKAIDALRTVAYASPLPNAKRVMAWYYPGGDSAKPPNAANQAAFDDWKARYSADPRLASLPDFQIFILHDPLIDNDLAQAIVTLKIP
jgi:hypothetical protein